MATEKHIALIRFDKVKSLTSGKYNLVNIEGHNMRLEGFENSFKNADPEKAKDNMIILSSENSLLDEYHKEVDLALAEGQMKYVRKDAVHAIETVAVFNKPQGSYTIEEVKNWALDATKWLQKEFGENNVKQVVLHMDEASPHIHAVIIPMTKDNRLNSHEYLKGKYDLSNKITRFTKEVAEKYGLERGIASKTKRKDISYKSISKFKEATLGKALANKELLEPKENELTDDGLIIPNAYLPRIKEEWDNHEIELLAKEQVIRKQVHDQEIEYTRRHEEYVRSLLQDIKKKTKKLNKILDIVKTKLKEGMSSEQVNKYFYSLDLLYKGTHNDKYPNKEEQKKINESMNKFIQWQKEQDKKEKQLSDEVEKMFED